MTIDEAIKHCEEEAEEQQKMGERNYDDDCLEYAKEYRQLAEWLKELKKYRAIFEKVGETLANNGFTIDDLYAIYVKTEGKEANADDNN